MEINVRPPVSRIFRFENNRICVGLIILFSALYFFPYIIQNKTMVAYDLLFNIQPWKSLANISYKNTMMGDVILQFAPWHVLYRNAFLFIIKNNFKKVVLMFVHILHFINKNITEPFL